MAFQLQRCRYNSSVPTYIQLGWALAGCVCPMVLAWLTFPSYVMASSIQLVTTYLPRHTSTNHLTYAYLYNDTYFTLSNIIIEIHQVSGYCKICGEIDIRYYL